MTRSLPHCIDQCVHSSTRRYMCRTSRQIGAIRAAHARAAQLPRQVRTTSGQACQAKQSHVDPADRARCLSPARRDSSNSYRARRRRRPISISLSSSPATSSSPCVVVAITAIRARLQQESTYSTRNGYGRAYLRLYDRGSREIAAGGRDGRASDRRGAVTGHGACAYREWEDILARPWAWSAGHPTAARPRRLPRQKPGLGCDVMWCDRVNKCPATSALWSGTCFRSLLMIVDGKPMLAAHCSLTKPLHTLVVINYCSWRNLRPS